MKAFIDNLLSSLQEPSQIAREGLPFWIFWLLLCVILLLVTFIFLRDKDLRQRVNAFFFGARRRFERLRLQVKIKKENQNKRDLFKELGNKTWEAGISHQQTGKISAEINALEKKKFLILHGLQNGLRSGDFECQPRGSDHNYHNPALVLS